MRQDDARFADGRVQAHGVDLAYVPQILHLCPVTYKPPPPQKRTLGASAGARGTLSCVVAGAFWLQRTDGL